MRIKATLDKFGRWIIWAFFATPIIILILLFLLFMYGMIPVGIEEGWI